MLILSQICTSEWATTKGTIRDIARQCRQKLNHRGQGKVSESALWSLQLKGSKSSVLFGVSLGLCISFGVSSIIFPDAMISGAKWMTTSVFDTSKWLILAPVSAFLFLAIALAVSPIGRKRLGGLAARPEFSTISWFAMLFSAGMGMGLLFFSAAEPLMHYSAPPVGTGGTPQAARDAMVITVYHWGLHAWAVYGVAAIALAVFATGRSAGDYLPGTPIRRAFRGAWVEPVAWLSDLLAVFAVAFGVAASIGLGVRQVQSGVGMLGGWDLGSPWFAVLILTIVFACYMASAATGLGKGIKILSNVNMGMAVLLIAIIFVVGPTGKILETIFTATTDYAVDLLPLSVGASPIQENTDWLGNWTLPYFVWWVSWAPFVGVFIARISRGRTIRQFVLGILVAPTAFTILSFGIYGGSAITADNATNGAISAVANEKAELAIFAVFEGLPLSSLTSIMVMLLMFIFLITSADSATFVLGTLTSGGAHDPPTKRKLAWGVCLAILAGALMFSGEVRDLVKVGVSAAIPYTLVMVLQVVAVLRLVTGRVRPPDDHEH